MVETPHKPLGLQESTESTRISFSFKGAAIALVKAQGLHEGIWRIYLRFHTTIGVNANINGHLSPAGLLAISEIGLVPDDTVHDLSVDAAVVNPACSIIQAVH